MVEGWGFPANSQKAHYFIDKKSLCNKWMFFGELEQGNDDGPDNCTACKKILQKRKAKKLTKKLETEGKLEF